MTPSCNLDRQLFSQRRFNNISNTMFGIPPVYLASASKINITTSWKYRSLCFESCSRCVEFIKANELRTIPALPQDLYACTSGQIHFCCCYVRNYNFDMVEKSSHRTLTRRSTLDTYLQVGLGCNSGGARMWFLKRVSLLPFTAIELFSREVQLVKYLLVT